jgi:flagellar basal body-associated protein FliL
MDMADKSKQDADGAAPKKSGKPRIIAGIICVALAGGAYVMGTRSSAPAAGTSGPTTTTTLQLFEGCRAEPEPGVPETIIDLPEMSINLADSHYLRVAVSLGLCADVVLETPEEFKAAPAKDIIVSTLSGRNMDDLGQSTGREEVRKALTEQISAEYPGEVYAVFFVEFVMQ